jgi:hypothetical protein
MRIALIAGLAAVLGGLVTLLALLAVFRFPGRSSSVTSERAIDRPSAESVATRGNIPSRVLTIVRPQEETAPAKETPAPPMGGSDRIGVPDQTYFLTMESTFNHQPRDIKWASQTEKEIEQITAAMTSAGTKLTKVRCAQTLCMALFQHETPDAQRRAPFLLESGPFMNGTHFQYARDTLQTTVIVQRAEPLPPPSAR